MAASSLKEVSSDADIIEISKLQYSTWCPNFTVDQYLLREEFLSHHKWIKEKRRSWILTKGEDAEKTDKLYQYALSSLETHQLEGIGPNGSKISVYGFASVFTEAKLRGNGYARALCEKVKDYIFNLDDKEKIIILFSDIGTSIYSKIGFHAPEEFPTNFVFHPAPNFDKIYLDKFSDKVQFLSREEIFPLVQRFSTELRDQVRDNEVVILPTPEHVDWQLAREHIASKIVKKEISKFSGASCNTNFIIWTLNYYKSSPVMNILLLKIVDNEFETLALIASAITHAKRYGIDQVVSWGLKSYIGNLSYEKISWNQAGISLEVKERVGSLPMIASSSDKLIPMWQYIPQALWF